MTLTPRRRFWVAILLAAGTVLLWWLGRPTPPAPSGPAASPAVGDFRPRPSAPGEPVGTTTAPNVVVGPRRLDTPEARLAERLNHPEHSLREDVAVVGSMVAAFRSIFRDLGNPVGNNRDITTALTGRNPRGMVFLLPDHPAIGPDGQLRDRFGNPFHFHAESGTRMMVRSGGPDGRLFTPDDVTMVP